jgi:hypothetical protein
MMRYKTDGLARMIFAFACVLCMAKPLFAEVLLASPFQDRLHHSEPTAGNTN